MTLTYPFSEEEAKRAHEEWGCNCGPTALAFALQVPLASVRTAIPDFEAKRYTSPTMMKAALANLGQEFQACPITSREEMCDRVRRRMALVRVQWTGKWTAPGANPRWAYRYTHWIACWEHRTSVYSVAVVFDCNGGVREMDSWESEIVPLLATHKGGDGGWEPTHVWRLKKGGGA